MTNVVVFIIYCLRLDIDKCINTGTYQHWELVSMFCTIFIFLNSNQT